MIKLNGLIKDNLLYEGLIHSVSPAEFDDMIKRWVISNDKFDVLLKNEKIQLNFKDNLNVKELNNLLQFINKLGWFVSAYLVYDIDMKWKSFDRESFISSRIKI